MAVGALGASRQNADLHTHTVASDGLLSPASLAELAGERGISIFAVTDHDTTGGLAEARAAAASQGIRFINGVEFSARARQGETHILGYGFDPHNPSLNEELLVLRESRRERGWLMLERLRDLGIDIDVIFSRGDQQSPGRPHIARALVQRGYAESVTDAFERYLEAGRPAFVPRRTVTAERAIELIRGARGVAVLAHPLSVDSLLERLPQLVAGGLQGLEAHYGEYDVDQRASLVSLARGHGLVVTGGSDFHGDGRTEGRAFGSVNWPAHDVEKFLTLLQ
jgi:predicted metal-dependent phosphoesterase TrpH